MNRGNGTTFWEHFSLHCSTRGWDHVTQFVVYTLGYNKRQIRTYADCELFIFSDPRPLYFFDGNNVVCSFYPGYRNEAIHRVKIICSFIRSFQWTLDVTGGPLLTIPMMEVPRDSLIGRIHEYNALMDFAFIGELFVFSNISYMHPTNFRLLMDSNKNVVEAEGDTRKIYPDLKELLAKSRVCDFVRYRTFSQQAKIPERYYHTETSYRGWDEWVWLPQYQIWVPAIYKWDYQHYMVRRKTAIRAAQRLIQEHDASIQKLLWQPPDALMARKGWLACVTLMQEENSPDVRLQRNFAPDKANGIRLDDSHPTDFGIMA